MKRVVFLVLLALTCAALPCAVHSMSIADAKASAQGATVTISGTLTAAFTNWFYVESPDRSCGIRVYKAAHGLLAPKQVVVTGTLTTSADGEQFISGTTITPSDATALAPLGMLSRDVGGYDFRYNPTPPRMGQQGTSRAVGLNTTGLLVRLAGTLQCTGGTRAVLSAPDRNVTVIAPPGGSFPSLQAPYPPAIVTGVSSCELNSSTGLLDPVIRLANSLSPDQHGIHWLTWPERGIPAQIEWDLSLPSGTDTATVSNNGGGASLRVLLYGEGTITDVLINGVALSTAFASRQPSGQSYYLYSPRFLADGVPTALMNAGEPVWYRIRPVQCGATTSTEIFVRLRTQPTSAVTVAAVRSNGTQVQVSVSPPSSIRPRFGFVTVSTARDVIHAYVLLPQSLPGEGVDRVRLDGTDVAAFSSAPNGYGNSGVLPVDITPSAPLAEGSYHLLECLLVSGEHVWATFRANNGFATAMFGNCNPDNGSMFYDLKNHYIDAWRGWTSNSSTAAIIAANNIRMAPNDQGDTLPGAEWLGRYSVEHGYDIYSYWMYDEPDVGDYFLGSTWGSVRVGLHAQYLVKLGEALAQGDPYHPSFLNTDLTYEPDNYYIYGQVADITSSDYYYPNFARSHGWNPLTLVYGKAKTHRAGAMPCPAIRFLNASPDPTAGVTRAPFPEEERIMAYAAIAAGDNGLFYYWYNCSSSYGCQYQTELWAEIAKINKQCKLLEPYIGASFPATFGVTVPSGAWARVAEAGTDTLIFVLVNTNFTSTESSFTYTPTSSVPIQVPLPTGRTPISAVTIDDTGPHALSFSVSGGKILFDAGPLQVGRLVLISFKPGLLEELTARWAALAL